MWLKENMVKHQKVSKYYDQDCRPRPEVTASEALDSLFAVKCFAEIHGDKQINVMLNELIGKVEILR